MSSPQVVDMLIFFARKGSEVCMKRWALLGIVLLLALTLTHTAQPAVAAESFPDVISLPDGFQPEGIEVGKNNTLYAGSRATGAIYRADLRTGEGAILVPAQPGAAALGIEYDNQTGYLFVAGGPTGNAYVYDANTGDTIAVIPLTASSPTFINDAVITRDGVYFTDSSRPFLYRVSRDGGKQSNTFIVQEIPLGGEFEFVEGEFNANGIEASANGKYLIVVNTTLGTLYRVNPRTGVAKKIDLDSDAVPNGDGILLIGQRLYVVQNFLNQVAVVELNKKFTSGEIVNVLTNPNFDIPTTIDHHGRSLYVVNARFTTPPQPDTSYTVVKVN
jgi:sugar lactone lactonase YvrE